MDSPYFALGPRERRGAHRAPRADPRHAHRGRPARRSRCCARSANLLSKLAGESGALGMFKVITSSMSMSLGLTNGVTLSGAREREAFQSLSVDDRNA